MKEKMLLLLILLATAAVRVSAQGREDIQVNVSAPEEMTVGTNCRIRFTINTNKVKTCVWPADAPADWLDIVLGPSRSQSISISTINGVRTESSSTTFTYVVKPLKEGLQLIPVAELTDSFDVSHRTMKLMVNVAPASEATSQNQTPAIDPYEFFFGPSSPATPDSAIDKAIKELEEDPDADPQITRLLSTWEGYIRQFRKEIDELSETDHGPGIPGMSIYQDEEKCYNQLTRQLDRMTSQQRALYDKLNAIYNNEFDMYMPRLMRE